MRKLPDGTWHCTAVSLGPTWNKDPEWDGPRTPDGFILPKLTFGYQVILWVQKNLLNDDGEPFRLTNEQKRFILWWYAVNEEGRVLHPSGVLQRLKGWRSEFGAKILLSRSSLASSSSDLAGSLGGRPRTIPSSALRRVTRSAERTLARGCR